MSPLDALESLIHGLRYRAVMRHFHDGGRLADLGSGNEPRFLLTVKDRVERCWGLDPWAQPFDDGKLTVTRGDITKRLPFEDAFLDQITCLAVLEHVDDPPPILRECLRCLRSGGRLIVTTPSHLGILVHELMRRLGLVRDVKEDEHHDFLMTPARLAGWLQEAGFRVEDAYTFEFGVNVLAVGLKP